jgi:O-antigen/teichoic acid export membrane protein
MDRVKSLQKLKKEATYVARHKRVHQTIVNVIANVLGTLIGLVTVTLIIRSIGSEAYGQFSLIITIVGTLNVVVGFGFFQAYARLLLPVEDRSTQQEIIGSGLVLFLSQMAILTVLTIAISPLIGHIYTDPTLTRILIMSSLITSTSIFYMFFYTTTRNLNHMYWQAGRDILQPLTYLLCIWIFIQTSTATSVLHIIAASQIGLMIPILAYIIYLRPNFSQVQEWWQHIKTERKEFGRHIYISQVWERLTYNLDTLMLGGIGYTQVTFYTLGNRLVAPIQLLSQKFTDASMRQFTHRTTIPKRVFLYNIIWWGIATTVLMLLAKPVILLLWGDEYLLIQSFLFLITLNVLAGNIYSVYISFLYNKRIGKEQKKHFFARGFINLAGNVLLIPLLSIKGAVIATLISNIYFLIGLHYEYTKYRSRNFHV